VPRPALFLLLALALLPACGWRSEPVSERADAYPVDVQDAVGALVTLTSKPEKIVSLTEDGSTTLEALGYDGEVVTLPPDVEARRIAEQEPDLVLAPIDITDERYDRIQEVAGAPIFRYGAATYEDGPRVFARLGLAVGRGPEGVALATKLREDLAATLSRIAETDRVPVFIDGGGTFTGLGADTDYGQLLQSVGGDSVFPTTTLVRFSGLQRAAPQAWVLTPEAETSLEDVRDPTSPLFEIPAIADGRMFPIDLGDYGLTPGLPDALNALVDQLHAAPQPPPPTPEEPTAPTGTDGDPATSGLTTEG
jgi:ABC-type Fe3+-hydroxamate transport system substrate-binding protein